MQQQRQTQKPKPKPTIPIMELLAYNSSVPARQILKKYGKADATGYKDLQIRLENLYKETIDKIQLEKELVDIHPHKELILRYLSPTPPVDTKVIVKEPTSACEGNPNCGCNKKMSSAEGLVVQPELIKTGVNTDLLISSVAIVAIVGLVIYSLKK